MQSLKIGAFGLAVRIAHPDKICYFVRMINDKTLPKLLRRISASYPEIAAQYVKTPEGDFTSISFAQYCEAALDFAGFLLSIGCSRGDCVGLISDNRKEWPYASMGIMAIGAADVPRGCDASAREISYILSFAGCRVAVIENSNQLKKIIGSKDELPGLKTLIMLEEPSEDDKMNAQGAFELLGFSDCLSTGKAWRTANAGAVEAELEKGTEDETATIIFTSGTTGEPKGVVLSHDNFLSQLEELPQRIPLNPGDRALSVLPVWHAFERLVEYVILVSATGIVYSKPVGSILLDDIAKMNPQLIPSVPRIWEAVYDGIYRAMRKKGGVTWALFRFFIAVALAHGACGRAVLGTGPRLNKGFRALKAAAAFIPWLLLKPLYALGSVLVYSKIRVKLGNAFRGGVSGGGALPPAIDAFFWALKICVVEGYGLTETAPVVAVRPIPKPVFGTIGTAISCCSVKIVDDEGKELPPGYLGTVMVKGRNVMKGYYKRPDLTAAVLSADGWLDTGDLGLKTLDGEIILRGRKKDTIVLRGGENVEPLPIEMKINESRFIASSMVIGQDQKCLAALVVPSQEELAAWAEENGIAGNYNEVIAHAEVRRLIEQEVVERVSVKNGFKPFELINRVALISKPFEPGVELSAKQEMMRFKILEIYSKEVNELFS